MSKLLYIPTIFGFSVEVYFILFIIVFPTYFIWRWVFKKFIKSKNLVRTAAWTSTFIATPLIYVGLVILFVFFVRYYPNHDFNQVKWFIDKEKRYELSKNIIHSKMLIGKTKVEVHQILGYEGNSNASNDWAYYLGIKPKLFNIDPDILEIEFKSGIVVNVRQFPE